VAEDQRIPDAAGLVVTQPQNSVLSQLKQAAMAEAELRQEPLENPLDQDPLDAVDAGAVNDDEAAFLAANGMAEDGEQPYIGETVEELPIAATAPTDPNATVSAALMAVGRWYNDAGILGEALRKHLTNVAGEVELHAFMSRLELLCGEVRHTVDQLETGMSTRLRQAIAEAVAA